jgi:hypothetical protein
VDPYVTPPRLLLVAGLVAVALGAADAFHFDRLGLVWDLALILGGLGALGLRVGGAAVTAYRARPGGPGARP